MTKQYCSEIPDSVRLLAPREDGEKSEVQFVFWGAYLRLGGRYSAVFCTAPLERYSPRLCEALLPMARKILENHNQQNQWRTIDLDPNMPDCMYDALAFQTVGDVRKLFSEAGIDDELCETLIHALLDCIRKGVDFEDAYARVIAADTFEIYDLHQDPRISESFRQLLLDDSKCRLISVDLAYYSHCISTSCGNIPISEEYALASLAEQAAYDPGTRFEFSDLQDRQDFYFELEFFVRSLDRPELMKRFQVLQQIGVPRIERLDLALDEYVGKACESGLLTTKQQLTSFQNSGRSLKKHTRDLL